MTQTNKPTNQAVRNWMHQRQAERSTPPSLEEVRRQLGWGLVEAAREAELQSKR